MISLPLLFAPFRALIGFKSDTHKSALRLAARALYLERHPAAVRRLRHHAVRASGPVRLWARPSNIADLDRPLDLRRSPSCWSAPAHTWFRPSGLALATDLVPPEDQPKVVGLMYVMLLLGMIISALVFGALLMDFNPAKLIQVVQGTAVLTVALNILALWKQEARDRNRAKNPPPKDPDFLDALRVFAQGAGAMRRLWAIGLGTMGFGMADVLLEPYGGQVLDLSVAATTKLTAVFAGGGLLGFAWASRVLGRGADPMTMAATGAFIGVPAFAAIILAAPGQAPWLFIAGTAFLGFGAGLFGHGTLTATMRLAPREQAGLALGAWGAVQATAAGIAVAVGGVMRDLIVASPIGGLYGHATAYIGVYALELVLIFAALAVMAPMVFNRSSQSPTDNSPAASR
jgi:BCD family chlorophyll transporter-like MFS transporter